MKAARVLVAAMACSLALAACTADPAAERRSERPAAGSHATKTPKAQRPSPTPTPAAEASDLAVVNSGFGRQSYDATTWWYAVVVKNPNTDFWFPTSEVTIEAVAADGTILDSDFTYVTILPGDIAISGTLFDVGQAEIDHLDVRGPAASEAQPAPSDGLGAFATADLSATSDTYSTTVGGIISSTFAKEQESVQVVVVASNPAGQIIGAEMTYVDRLPVDGKVHFEVTFLDVLPADTTYAAYPAA